MRNLGCMAFKVIVAGGREFRDYGLLCRELDRLLANKTDIEIVSGKEPNGADRLGEDYAKQKGYPVTQFPANWLKYGKSAGPIRNEEMAIYADACVCFWDGKSRGTKSMINLAGKHGIALRIVRY